MGGPVLSSTFTWDRSTRDHLPQCLSKVKAFSPKIVCLYRHYFLKLRNKAIPLSSPRDVHQTNQEMQSHRGQICHANTAVMNSRSRDSYIPETSI